MRSRWCSEPARRAGWLAALLLACCLPAAPALGHPDLLAQIDRLGAQLALQPENTGLLIQRGDLFRRHGDFDAAARDFSAARSLDPHNVMLDFYQGRLQLETGDATQADALLSRYLESHAEHAAAWSLLGRARLARGEPDAAARDFARAIVHAAHPTPALYLEQAVALLSAGESHWPQARAAANTGLARHPQDVALLGLATDISLALTEGDPAAGYIERLPAALGELPQWRSRLESLDCMRLAETATSDCAEPARGRIDRLVRNASQAVTMNAD